MPASSYPRQLQSIPPPAPPRASTHGRYPLTDAIHHNQYQPHQAAQDTHYKRAPQHDVPPPVPEKQPQQQQNVPASPPLPRQNAKVQPPSPPQVIRDKSRAMNFKRVGFLGEVCLVFVSAFLRVGRFYRNLRIDCLFEVHALLG